jgi:hypothetical protein
MVWYWLLLLFFFEVTAKALPLFLLDDKKNKVAA